VFDDPLAVSRLDDIADEERWQIVGEIGGLIVFVVHTWPEPIRIGEETGRIIRARKATARERKAYEEGEFQTADGKPEKGTGRFGAADGRGN
jgi:uncharacterized DUF497 family protein